MGKELKVALAVAVLVAIGIVIAVLTIKPAPEVWSRGELIRQLVGLGIAGIVLVFVVAVVERPPAPRKSDQSTTEPSNG